LHQLLKPTEVIRVDVPLYSPARDTHTHMLFSYGTYPSGPLRLDPQEPEALSSARFGEHVITSDDIVFADDDGVAFVPADRVDEVLDAARAIWQVNASRRRGSRPARHCVRRHRLMSTCPAVPTICRTRSANTCGKSAAQSRNDHAARP
jgi:hypothetical protein